MSKCTLKIKEQMVTKPSLMWRCPYCDYATDKLYRDWEQKAADHLDHRHSGTHELVICPDCGKS